MITTLPRLLLTKPEQYGKLFKQTSHNKQGLIHKIEKENKQTQTTNN